MPASSSTTTKATPIPCSAACEDGKVSIERFGFLRVVEVADCERCGGSGLEPCARAGCAAPATLRGIDGDAVYCTVQHAWEELNWDACVQCEAHPQDPVEAPFCGRTCATAYFGRVYAARVVPQPSPSAEVA